MDVPEPFYSLKELKEVGMYPEDFVEDLAPPRYHGFKHFLEQFLKGLKHLAFIVYGLRRMGKTYALIKLGEFAQEKLGLEFLYYELSTLDEYFVPPKAAHYTAARLKKFLEETGRDAFIVLDEAFNVPLASLQSFLGTLSKTERRFVLYFAGSYTYDVEGLSAAISRILPHMEKLNSATFYTVPRVNKHVSKHINRLHIFLPPAPPSLPNIAYLVQLDILDGKTMQLRAHVLNEVQEVNNKGGIPLVLKGKAQFEDVLRALVKLLKDSFSGEVEYYKQKIDRSVVDRPSPEDLVEILQKRMRGSTSGVDIDLGDFQQKIALSTCLVLPRREVKATGLDELSEAVTKTMRAIELDFELRAHPIPASPLAKRIMDYIGIKMPYTGIEQEALVASALVNHLQKVYLGYPLHGLPIFSSSYIDFIITYPAEESSIYLGIEVKSSLADRKSISKTFASAALLGMDIIIALPASVLENRVPYYTAKLMEIPKLRPSVELSRDELTITIVRSGIGTKFKLRNFPESELENLYKAIQDVFDRGLQVLPMFVPIELLAYIARRVYDTFWLCFRPLQRSRLLPLGCSQTRALR